MTDIKEIFKALEKIIKVEDNTNFMTSIFTKEHDNLLIYQNLLEFLQDIILKIDTLAREINSSNVLISVKDQKVLRTCFQVIISFGIIPCLVPGLGISLTKRCIAAHMLLPLPLDDKQKYEVLTICTDFLHRCYNIPVLKNIIITFHLCDYIAALIQLAFAPLKNPGVYSNFTMTQEMYNKLVIDRQKYLNMYEYLVSNCFQPILMKEILVLQNTNDVPPPAFVKRVIAKEMSRRLTSSGGLLSLIRCFIESHSLDTGIEWKKIDMICKIVTTKHGNMSENDYIINICSQLKQILSLNNAQYLTTAISCLLELYNKYESYEIVKELTVKTFGNFNYEMLLLKSNSPGTIILTAQEIEHNIHVLHSFINVTNIEQVSHLLSQNLYVLYLLNIACSKNETKKKLNDIILKCLECLNKTNLTISIENILFGLDKAGPFHLLIEEFEAGLVIKFVSSPMEHPTDKAVQLFLELFNLASNNKLVNDMFETSLQIFINLNGKRNNNIDKESLMSLEENLAVINTDDERKMNILYLLSELSSSKKVLSTVKSNPLIVIEFVENMILKTINSCNDECITIALVLLNTILANITKTSTLKDRLHTLVPNLKKIAKDNSNILSILCKETISLILCEYPKQAESPYEKALSNVYDEHLPVRAHGVMELAKLIDAGDQETISKRHFVFCLFQEQLKDSDSYIYLAAINGIASLGTHCTDDVIAVLCREYLDMTQEKNKVQTLNEENNAAELRMKIGDIIVKTTRKLGEMAIVHKSILLNTFLCGCRDEDPFMRTSALSNLAEIAKVLHYKMGTIIYEVLLCISSIIQSDKAIECRRAAVMVITNLLKGLGKDTLVELKENILPIYRTLNKLYKNDSEDSVLRLHAQVALEEINDIVRQFLHTGLPMEKEFTLSNQNEIKFK